jgi:hypothetical protein
VGAGRDRSDLGRVNGDAAIVVEEDRVGEAERADRLGDLLNLLLWVGPGAARVWN